MKTSLLALCLSLVSLSGLALAQPTNQRAPQSAARSYAPASNALNAQITQAERTQNSDALLLAYGQAVTDADAARAAIAQLLSSYYTLRNQARTADQVVQSVAEANLRFQVLQAAQNQIMVQQNQQILQQNAQIIALLRQNARTR